MRIWIAVYLSARGEARGLVTNKEEEFVRSMLRGACYQFICASDSSEMWKKGRGEFALLFSQELTFKIEVADNNAK